MKNNKETGAKNCCWLGTWFMEHQVGSPLRRMYMGRFWGRCITLAAGVLLYFYGEDQFSVLSGMGFFQQLSLLHVIWCVWMADMLMQLVPLRNLVSLGSQKLFALHFRAAENHGQPQALRAYIRRQNHRAAGIAAVWGILVAAIGLLYSKRILNGRMLFLITLFFYVCDLICVLFWCPFRVVFLQNRCCTTCRIFNWDHLMMFSPLVYLKSFYAWSLILSAVVVFVVWEAQVYRHPERFWEGTNQALKCGECTDQLCMRYSRLWKK